MASKSTMEAPGLHRLSELDDEAAGWEPDLRGWDLWDPGGARVGQIEDLIVDPAAGKVRYFDVELDLQYAGTDVVRHVLVPVGVVARDEQEHRAVLRGIGREAILNAPGYTGLPVGRDYEVALRRAYATSGAADGDEADFYAHEHFEMGHFYGEERR